MYGVELHKAKDNTNKNLQLGVTFIGLVVFQNNLRINTFSWSKIKKISFKRKQFFILLQREPSESYGTQLGFNMETYRSCKTLWKACVEHHTFSRLHSPKVPRRFPLSFGSKFRYSGRTEYQTVSDVKQHGKLERKFVRSPSKNLLTDADQELYKNFPLVISERWQTEVAETVFETINFEADKAEHKKKAKQKKLFDLDEKESNCILHGYIKKLGGPWTSSWQMRYAKLYPNRLELHPDSAKPEMVFMDQVEEVSPELVQVKNEQCIVVRLRDGKVVLTNPDEIGLKEWLTSLKSAHKISQELLGSMAKKAGKIYGTDSNNRNAIIAAHRNANGN